MIKQWKLCWGIKFYFYFVSLFRFLSCSKLVLPHQKSLFWISFDYKMTIDEEGNDTEISRRRQDFIFLSIIIMLDIFHVNILQHIFISNHQETERQKKKKEKKHRRDNVKISENKFLWPILRCLLQWSLLFLFLFFDCCSLFGYFTFMILVLDSHEIHEIHEIHETPGTLINLINIYYTFNGN